MTQVLLLNPPSAIPCARVLHRSNLGKPGYVWPPVDFVCLSGRLWEAGFSLTYKDFQIEAGTSIWKFLASRRFDVVISAYCPFFEEQDLSLLGRIRDAYPDLMLVLLANQKDRIEPRHAEGILRNHRHIAAIVYDYAYNNIPEFLNGGRNGEIFNVLYLENGTLQGQIRPIPRQFEIPVPRHELFRSRAYFHYDGVGGFLTSTMSSFGCRQKCPFCWGPRLYPAVSARTPENMLAELEHIAACGIQEVYFNDLSFAHDRKTALELCRLLARKNLRLRWFCSSRFDLMNGELIEAMAAAGCRCIEFGLESGNYRTRKLYGKDISDARVLDVARLCRRHGIHTSVFVILGLPEETLADMKESLRFVRKADFDYLSLNVMWAEPNTEFGKRIGAALIDASGTGYANRMNFKHPHVSNEQVERLYRETFRRFYLRPQFILRQLFAIRSFKKIINMAKILLELIRKDKL